MDSDSGNLEVSAGRASTEGEDKWAMLARTGQLSREVADASRALATRMADWEDPDVQLVYRLLCSDEMPPTGEHWEGFSARKIVAALRQKTIEA